MKLHERYCLRLINHASKISLIYIFQRGHSSNLSVENCAFFGLMFQYVFSDPHSESGFVTSNRAKDVDAREIWKI